MKQPTPTPAQLQQLTFMALRYRQAVDDRNVYYALSAVGSEMAHPRIVADEVDKWYSCFLAAMEIKGAAEAWQDGMWVLFVVDLKRRLPTSCLGRLI